MTRRANGPVSVDQPSPDTAATIQRQLLTWYANHARSLPWRSRPIDAYRVLVSEIMLQQTQVDRVVGKYQQFLERFPTLGDLASAPLADVIRTWRPLGYNRRAVRLWHIAKQIQESRGGRIPSTVEELLALDGIGQYTAAAIASFAYERDAATVDTNVRRVLRRLVDGLDKAPRSDRNARWLAAAMLPAGQSSSWNQALMDLGARICTARRPACPDCPVRAMCKAHTEFLASGKEDRSAFFASREAKVPRAREGRFVGSNRELRGRIVSALGLLSVGQSLPLLELGRVLHEESTVYEATRIVKLVQDLEADGLVQVDRDPSGVEVVSLPGD